VVARIDADFEVARIDGDEAKAGAILKTHESCRHSILAST
jgi:hypothetical protein